MKSKYLPFFVSFVIFLVFIFFSYLVAKEFFYQIDFDSTVKLQDRFSRNWDYPFSILSVIGSAEVTSLIWASLALLCLVKKYWKALFALPLFFVSVAIEVFGKLFVMHPGPPHLFYRGVIDFNFPSHYVHTNFSYPSGHMTRTAFLASFLFLFLHYKWPHLFGRIFQVGLIMFIIAMTISRVYLGEHWLSDVIGGLLLGISFGIIPALLLPVRKKMSHSEVG
jgi:membrane-associated phospholipid phosphatase